MASSDTNFGSDDQSGLDPLSSDISPDLNEIISELDMAEVDDLDLSSFLEGETIKPSGYSYRDLYSMNAPSSLENPMNVISGQTEDILKPLMAATSTLPSSDNSSLSEPQQYWGQKRDFSQVEATNLALPSPSMNSSQQNFDWGKRYDNIYNGTDAGFSETIGYFPIHPNSLTPEVILSSTSSQQSQPPIQEENSNSKPNGREKKRKKLSPEEKQMKRKQQTRAASKLYRQRKKELESQLSERLDELEKEKKLLIQEKKAAEEVMKKLKEENERLRSNQKVFSQENAKTRLELLVKLQKQINTGATDEELKQSINEINKCNYGCMAVGKCNLQAVINPAAVQQLVNAGFFEQTINSEISKKGTIEDLVEKIKTETTSLSADQIEAIDSVVADHNEKLRVILVERNAIAADIVKSFKSLNISGDITQSKDYLDVVVKLEHLRKNLNDEARLWTASLHAIADNILTPLQHAQFLVKVEFQHASVRQLSTFWQAINKTLSQSLLPS